MFLWQNIVRVQLFVAKTLSSAFFRPVPEEAQHFIGKIIKNIPMRIVNQEKGDTFLPLKLFHKSHLMFVNILECKRIHGTFFGVKTYRNALYGADIIDGTFLFKISERDVSALLIDSNRRDWSRNLLNERKSVLQIFFIGAVYQIFQSGTAQPSGIPSCHTGIIHAFLSVCGANLYVLTLSNIFGTGA